MIRVQIRTNQLTNGPPRIFDLNSQLFRNLNVVGISSVLNICLGDDFNGRRRRQEIGKLLCWKWNYGNCQSQGSPIQSHLPVWFSLPLITWLTDIMEMRWFVEPWLKLKRNIQVAKKSELLPHLSKKNFHAHNTGKEMFASNSQMSKFHDLHKYYDHYQYDHLHDHQLSAYRYCTCMIILLKSLVISTNVLKRLNCFISSSMIVLFIWSWDSYDRTTAIITWLSFLWSWDSHNQRNTKIAGFHDRKISMIANFYDR